MVIETIQHQDLKWYHILTPTEENLKFLQDNFHFHPLDIEDCRSKTQRPKIDIYDDYYFVILHFPYYDKVNKFLKTKEVKIFWGKDYIITVGNSHWVVRDLFNRAKENKKLTEELLSESSDRLLYRILERILSKILWNEFIHLIIEIMWFGDVVNLPPFLMFKQKRDIKKLVKKL